MITMRLKNETTTKNAQGEETVTSKTYAIKVSNDEFYMTFVKFLAPFFELTQPIDIKLMVVLCTMAEFNTGIVRITSDDKKEIADTLGAKIHSVENSILRLKKKNLINGERGRYSINHFIFWKGTTEERSRLIKESRLNVSFDFEKE